MQSLQFLPHFPINNWQLLVFAVLLLVGYAIGDLFWRIKLPRMLGYVAVGLVLGDTGLNVITEAVRHDMRLFIDVGLGLLLYELGQRLDFAWIRRERWMWVTAVSEILLTWLLVYSVLSFFGFDHLEALLLGAVVVSTSPVIVMYMARELKADGQVTHRILTLAAINSMTAFIISATMLSWVHYEHDGGVGQMLLHPLYLLFGSFALGVAVFAIVRELARWFGKSEAPQFVLTMGMVLLAVGLADALRLSVLCTMLTIGFLAKNADPKRLIRHIEFGVASELFYVVLFVSAGAAIHLSFSGRIWIAALALAGARYLGKAIPVYGLSALTPLGISRAGLVAMGLTPLSGFTALLVLDTTSGYSAIGPDLFSVFLLAVAILEIAGPLLMQFALRRAREFDPTRP